MERIYILRNKHFSHLVKIGRTSKTIEERVRQMNGTSVPGITVELYYCEIGDEQSLEGLVHNELRDVRDRNEREWFKISGIDAMQTIRTVATRNGIWLRNEWVSDDLKCEDRKRLFEAIRCGLGAIEAYAWTKGAEADGLRVKIQEFKAASCFVRIVRRGELLHAIDSLRRAELDLADLQEEIRLLQLLLKENQITAKLRETAQKWLTSI